MSSDDSIRVGTVSHVDTTNHTAKVHFTELDDSVSDLSIIDNGTDWTPKIDDEVLCIFLSNSPDTGFILGKKKFP